MKNLMMIILLPFLGISVLASPASAQTNLRPGNEVLPDGRILLSKSVSADESMQLGRPSRWDYQGPVLGAFSDGGNGHYQGGLQVTFPFECLSTLGKDLEQGTLTIYDQFRGRDATVAAIMRRNPASFVAQVDGTVAPLPAEDAARLANAEAEGPGFWGRPTTYATGLGAGVLAWTINEQTSGGGSGSTGQTIAIEGNGNAVSTGRGNATADNSSAVTHAPAEPAQ